MGATATSIPGQDMILSVLPFLAEARASKLCVLPKQVMVQGLLDSAKANRLAAHLVAELCGPGAVLGQDARLAYAEPEMSIPHDELWTDPATAVIHGAFRDIFAAIDVDLLHQLPGHLVFNDHRYWKLYLYQTILRVHHLHQALLRKGMSSGTILEVGAQFGLFSLALQRLGYQVSAVDRFDLYRPCIEPHLALLREAGVTIIKTTRESEYEIMASLKGFDATISMAVIEHVPHTARLFLEALKKTVRKNGLMAFDTPNAARYWNVRRLIEGQTVYDYLPHRHVTEIPYEGHHREYTGEELAWMLQHLGAQDIETTYFDYNMLQFDYIDRPHLECLLAINEKPALSDQLLVCARLGEE